jgi:hypothetical protein
MHPTPWQRSSRYAVTPTLSVEAVQERLICEDDTAVAERFRGAVGGVVSEDKAGLTATNCKIQRPFKEPVFKEPESA